MRKHNGMRPHDVAILLKIILMVDQKLTDGRTSSLLGIRISAISESLNRSRTAGFIY